MLMLSLWFSSETGELVATLIEPINKFYFTGKPEYVNTSVINTECPDMRTALTVACAWERTGRKA